MSSNNKLFRKIPEKKRGGEGEANCKWSENSILIMLKNGSSQPQNPLLPSWQGPC